MVIFLLLQKHFVVCLSEQSSEQTIPSLTYCDIQYLAQYLVESWLLVFAWFSESSCILERYSLQKADVVDLISYYLIWMRKSFEQCR